MEKEYLLTPLWNESLPLKERIDYAVRQLTLDEKFGFLTTGCPRIERMGITPFWVGGEAAHGIEARRDQDFNRGESICTTSFSQPIGMSATWDKVLIEQAGEVVGKEARILYQEEGGGGLCRWAPTIDMERDPRWGRTEEAYGEDPFLTGEMASAYVLGMRGRDPFYIRTGATLKHFYGNNVEKDRIKASSSIDLRNKHEYYLEPFRRVIVEGKAEAVMTSYNEINGIPAIVNSEIRSLCKEKWGLLGHVVCDGGDMAQTVNDHGYFGSHAETIAYGLKAGIDCFTDNGELVETAAREAYELSMITEEDLNQSIRHYLSTLIRLGIFDRTPKTPFDNVPKTLLGCDEHGALALKVAEKSLVLLKNEEELLPFSGKEEKIGVIGPLSDVWYKDWYCGVPPYQVTPYEGIINQFGTQHVLLEDGLDQVYIKYGEQYVGISEDHRARVVKKEEADLFVLTDWGFGSVTFQCVRTKKFLCSQQNSGPITATKKEAFGWFIMEAFDIKKEKDQVVFETWNDGSVSVDEQGYLYGYKEEKEESTLCFQVNDSRKENKITQEIKSSKFTLEFQKRGIDSAVSLAKNVEKVVVVLGSNPVINGKEDVDRTDIILPEAQEELLKKICEVNKNVVLVLISNYPYGISWAKEHVKSILQVASGSQELGNAIGNVISGKVSPAGRLPMTWYRDINQLPKMEDYDIRKGKRTYQYFDQEVLFAFGHGLSYTCFSYSEFSVFELDRSSIEVSVCVTNTGKCHGEEVVQIYMEALNSRVERPKNQLKAFERIYLKTGECTICKFRILKDEFKYYDVISNRMILETGDYLVKVGASSKDIRAFQKIHLEGSRPGTRDLTKRSGAQQYDDYENAYLHIGKRGYSAVVPVSVDKSMKLWYRNAKISSVGCNGVLFDLWVKESGIIRLYADETLIGTFEVNQTKHFKDIIFCLLEGIRFPVDQEFTLKIEVEGNISVSDFRMLMI